MQAEIIAIGDEILIGQTIDTNSSFIAAQLNAQGIEVKQKRVVSDDRESILEALERVHPQSRLVFMTGGLGPTKDDITKQTLNEYFEGELLYRPEVFTHITALFKSLNRVPSALNKSQAYLPSVCTPIPNALGTASGMRFERKGVYYFSLPGVPYETERLVEKEIIPWINHTLQKGTVVHKTTLTQGVPESELAELLTEWENNLPEWLHLAYLPSAGMVKLRLSSYDQPPALAQKQIEEEFAKLPSILGDILFGEDANTLQEVIGWELGKRNMTVSTAESCTGGYIGHLITSVSGSSTYYMGSVVSYSNEAKRDLLGVNGQLIATHGAVSEEVVRAMAEGARQKLRTDFALATSGVAGPTGGTAQKPVGTVWIAIAGPDFVKARKFSFGRNRERNIRKSALMALDWLRKEVQKIK